ncbi:hypothetical protein A6R68_13094, partial [Neotoma lepida]
MEKEAKSERFCFRMPACSLRLFPNAPVATIASCVAEGTVSLLAEDESLEDESLGDAYTQISFPLLLSLANRMNQAAVTSVLE